MEKGIIEMGRDFLADFVGFERGVFYTIKKLAFEPYEVVEAYKAKDSRICTPFSLIVLVFGVFFFVAGQTGVDQFLFTKIERLSKVAGIPEIAALIPLFWANLPFILSVYIVLTCSFLALLTRKLQLSFYDHVVANLYNLAVSMLPFSALILILPIINFNQTIFYLLMSATALLMIKLKAIKLRILFYYPEEVRDALKKPMMISGLFLILLMLAPLFWLIFTGRL
jgi:hypothetical protein